MRSLRALLAAAAASAATCATVVVYGSTPGGIMAAVAAARGGAATTLVDPSPRLGGMVSGGLGFSDKGDTSAIGGLARAFVLASRAASAGRVPPPGGNASEPLYAFEPHVGEATLAAFLAQAGVAVVRAAPGVAAVPRAAGGAALAALVTADGQRFPADVFVDGTYEGDLMRAAGVAHTWGREAVAAYNESWAGRKNPFSGAFGDFRPFSPLDASGALLPLLTTRLSVAPGAGDDRVQGYNYRLCVTTNASGRIPFPAPAAYDAATWEVGRRLAAGMAEPDFRRWVGPGQLPVGDKYDLNNGCLISTDATGLEWAWPNATVAQRAALAAQHKEYMLQFFHFLLTDPALPAALRASTAEWGLCADEFVTNGGWPEQLYVREASRAVGDRVLVQSDLWPATDFGLASIGMGSYAADGHYSTRGPCEAAADNKTCAMVTTEAQLQAAAAAGRLWTGGEGYVGVTSASALYQIPYWALLPRRADATNLLLPLTPSTSHVTFASLRVEPQFMILGEAAGAAAAIAAARGVAVHDIPLDALRADLASHGAVLCKEGAPQCDKAAR